MASGPRIRADVQPVKELDTQKARPPADLLKACDSPVDIPVGPLAAGPTERLWARDRAALVLCGDRHKTLDRFYQRRDGLLAGSG